jgi:phage-related protein
MIRIHISKNNIQHNDQKKKYKRTNNDLKNIKQKIKDRVTRHMGYLSLSWYDIPEHVVSLGISLIEG